MEPILGLDRSALDRARVSRDPRFDGKFFIAVVSTGIYCRPICPVPSPKKANVRYYATAAAAAEAGFRPCLRCRPEAAPGTPAWLGTSAVVRRGLRLIQDGALDAVSVERLATRLGIGPRHLRRLFLRHLGATPVTLAQTRRLHFAKRLLDATELPITDVALAAGFGSVRRFNAVFRGTYGRAPRELRKRRGAPAEAGDGVALELAFRPPYDWEQVRDFLAVRAVPGVERVDAQGYARTVAMNGAHAVVRLRPVAEERALELRVHGAAPEVLFQLVSTARRAFDLAADPDRIARELGRDRLLAPFVRRRPGLRIPGAWDPFECAVRAVLGQQVSVAAARTLAARLVARAGKRIAGDAADLTHLFPDAKALAAANLDGLGITGARVAALRALSRAVIEGAVDFAAPVEEVQAALAALPGFGSWTAQYVALRALGEPDAFPAADLVLRRVAAAGGPPFTSRALESRAEAWRPWRGYAVFHLWRAAQDRAARGDRVRMRPVPRRVSAQITGSADVSR
ncbi:MAG TPA: AlkA N-terminal domain-containing protein [Vicinamibacteria bacterium]|nr:AlkA N-terminal domain-containing protein [Vicinamibacteria bacterium]